MRAEASQCADVGADFFAPAFPELSPVAAPNRACDGTWILVCENAGLQCTRIKKKATRAINASL